MAHGARHLEQQRPISCVGARTTGVARIGASDPRERQVQLGRWPVPHRHGPPLLPHDGEALFGGGHVGGAGAGVR